ncbi:MAG TPA: alkaline phosphatase family protein [Candidatus Bathyarchaeia archaeon]
MKARTFALVLLIVLQVAFTGYVDASTNTYNVILISFDGYQLEHMWEQLEAGDLPNLKKLMDGGVYLELSQMDYLTQTKVAHAQMLSGYQSATTGVYSNKHLFHALPTGYTFLERAEEYLGNDNVATGFISGKRTNIAPVFSMMEDLDYVSIHHEYLENVTGGTGEKFLGFIEEYHDKRFVAFFHTTEPDKLGHIYGENSQEYSDGGEMCDKYLGLIMDKLEQHNISDRTLIYVCTDHGFAEGGFNHLHEPKTWLITNDQRLKVNQGDARLLLPDIAATTMYSIGIPLDGLMLQGYPLQEPLPQEADNRLEVMKDSSPPTVHIDEDVNLTKQFIDRKPITIKWRIEDDRELSRSYITVKGVGNKYVNGSCGSLVYKSDEIEGLEASFETEFTLPNELNVYEVSVYGVDARENIVVETIILGSDKVPPQIEIRGIGVIQLVIDGIFNLECEFTDLTGITLIEIYIDNTELMINTCDKTTVKNINQTLYLSEYMQGIHTITVKAIDIAGNEASKDITIFMVNNRYSYNLIINIIGLIIGILSFGILYRKLSS